MRYIIVILLLTLHVSLQSQNINISQQKYFDGEPYLAINPTNSQNMTVAWMGYVVGGTISIRYSTSFDGGRTFTSVKTIPHLKKGFESADVSMQYGKNGLLYMCFIDYQKSPDSGGIVICSSNDGGKSFTSPIKFVDMYADGTKKPVDRPWLVIDTFKSNQMYITSKPPTWVGGFNRPYLFTSTDNGKTWSKFKYIDSSFGGYKNTIAQPMAAPAVDKSGRFCAVYPYYNTSYSVYPSYNLISSNDGGKTLKYNQIYQPKTGAKSSLPKLGYRLIANPTDKNHLIFFDLETLNGDLDVFAHQSFDGGATWSIGQRINDDKVSNGRLQDLVWADFDVKGNTIVSWRDRRNAPDTGYSTSTEIWGCYKPKDSVNFGKNFRISDTIVSYNNVLAQSGNDFQCIKLVSDTIIDVWGDTRTGKLNIWLMKKSIKDYKTIMLSNILANDENGIRIWYNNQLKTIHIEGIQNTPYQSFIYDLNGRQLVNSNDKEIECRGLNPQIYLVKVMNKKGKVLSIKKIFIN